MLKNQQVSIQGLKTQIGQLAKLISERPKGSLPSNTETNPREQLHTTTVQYEEGFVEFKAEPRQETVVSELTLHVGDKTITFQARDSIKTSSDEGNLLNPDNKTNHVVQPSLQEKSLSHTNEPRSGSFENIRIICEERRLQIDELDEWRAHVKEEPKRLNVESKQNHDKYKDETNQFKVGDQVLLDETDPRIITTELNANGATPFTVLKVFSYGTVKVTHSHFSTFKVNSTRLKPYLSKGIDSKKEEFQPRDPP
ncbi:hypothetical protein GOBAR_AA19405 [Gossypium barbadense]|uniref:Uncharacterized protein n=1 Tax=Gossypium barbadense TaxID=3634 RepID=A0A2P5XD30_GOSBA|nr:hypothetical protein GOBAR_AA19405 [Gossypium barbadense]